MGLGETPREVRLEKEASGGRPHSPTCRLAENWKMAVTGAVNRPEARLTPEPRRRAPWAVGCRDGRGAATGPQLARPAWGRRQAGPRWARWGRRVTYVSLPTWASGHRLQ